ncbi:hypothetical protein GCM10020358_27580 [Amorphoplanes nipponensis]
MTVNRAAGPDGSRLNGGYGPSQAAKEALTRDLSAELAPHGIRVVGLRAHGNAGDPHDAGCVRRQDHGGHLGGVSRPTWPGRRIRAG